MPELVAPDVRYQRSFLEAAEEILWSSDDDHYAGLSVFPTVDDYPGEEFALDELRSADDVRASSLRRLRATADDATWFPEGIVPSTVLWWVDGDTYLGRLAIRHSLTPGCATSAATSGTSCGPAARGHGHATAMLGRRAAHRRRLGIDPALVTCDDTNLRLAQGDRGQRRRLRVPARHQAPLLGIAG